MISKQTKKTYNEKKRQWNYMKYRKKETKKYKSWTNKFDLLILVKDVCKWKCFYWKKFVVSEKNKYRNGCLRKSEIVYRAFTKIFLKCIKYFLLHQYIILPRFYFKILSKI